MSQVCRLNGGEGHLRRGTGLSGRVSDYCFKHAKLQSPSLSEGKLSPDSAEGAVARERVKTATREALPAEARAHLTAEAGAG